MAGRGLLSCNNVAQGAKHTTGKAHKGKGTQGERHTRGKAYKGKGIQRARGTECMIVLRMKSKSAAGGHELHNSTGSLSMHGSQSQRAVHSV